MDRRHRFPPVRRIAMVGLAGGLTLAALTGCRSTPPTGAGGDSTSPAGGAGPGASAAPTPAAPGASGTTAQASPAQPAQAVAVIRGAGENAGKISGRITFFQAGDRVRVVADVAGLSPGKHGFHIHESPDLSAPDLKTAGPDYNPEGTKHGGPDSVMRHAGDLGNLTADEQGRATLDRLFQGISVNGPADKVVSHSVVIHANEDDLKTDPEGKSGPGIAGGVIVAGPDRAARTAAGAAAGAAAGPASAPATEP